MAVRGFIATVLDVFRTTRGGAHVTDVKCDPGGGGNITVEQMGPPGDDSPPLPTDSVGALPVEGSGRVVAAGYADPFNPSDREPGEKRLYSRDSNGTVKAAIVLDGEGSVTVKHAATGAVVQLQENGLIVVGESGGASAIFDNASGLVVLTSGAPGVFVNGTKIDSSGNILLAAGADITTDSIASLNAHPHSPGTYKDHTGATITGSSGGPS
ncbi:MAG: hypothetical protein V3W41_14490 [Planctomycetota bacterium]